MWFYLVLIDDSCCISGLVYKCILYMYAYCLCITNIVTVMIEERKKGSGSNLLSTCHCFKSGKVIQFISIHIRVNSIYFYIHATEDGRSMSVFSVYWQLSQGQMAKFSAFIASKSFDPWNHHQPQMKWHNLQQILMH